MKTNICCLYLHKKVASIVFLLILFHTCSLQSQNSPLPDTLRSGREFEDVNRIFAQIIRSNGLHFDPKKMPIVLIAHAPDAFVAKTYSVKRKIFLAKEIYDICMTLSPAKREAALAFIIGHELAHLNESIFPNQSQGFVPNPQGDSPQTDSLLKSTETTKFRAGFYIDSR